MVSKCAWTQEYARDLHAADAVYHQSCSVNFRTFKTVPKPFSPKVDKHENIESRGRPVHLNEAFQRVSDSPLLMCSECVSLSVNFYRKTGGVRMRGHETSSSAQRDVPEFLSFSHRKWVLLD